MYTDNNVSFSIHELLLQNSQVTRLARLPYSIFALNLESNVLIDTKKCNINLLAPELFFFNFGTSCI